jgi:hypothetical protein
VTKAIWTDMAAYIGYVVSRWTSLKPADEVLTLYRPHPNAQAADRLVSEPRRRFVARLAGDDAA